MQKKKYINKTYKVVFLMLKLKLKCKIIFKTMYSNNIEICLLYLLILNY